MIPFFKGDAWIARAVASVRAQDWPTRVILVNDGSPETTALDSLDVDVRIDQENQGTAAARNAALRRCTSPFVAFLDQDDYWLPGKLRAQVPVLDRADLVHGGVRFVDEHDDVSLEWLPPGATSLESLVAWCTIMVQTVVLRRDILDRVGGFDATVSGADDWDLWIRLGVAGARMESVPAIHTAMMGHSNQQSMTIANHHAAMRAVIEKHSSVAPRASRLARRRLSADLYTKRRNAARAEHGLARARLTARAVRDHPAALISTPLFHVRRVLRDARGGDDS